MGYYFRFIIYSFSILLALYLVRFALKRYGENQPLSTYQTELVKKLAQFEGPLSWKPHSKAEKSEFVWLKTIFENGNWITDDSKKPSLELVLSQFPSEFKLLFIDAKGPQALPHLRTLLEKNKAWEKIIICSRADGLLKDLRELEPEWTYCSGEVYLTRFLAMTSIGLGSLSPVRSDVFFIHLQELNLSKNLLKVLTEAKRQNKLIFTGPVARPLDGYSIDHWLVQ